MTSEKIHLQTGIDISIKKLCISNLLNRFMTSNLNFNLTYDV